MKIFVNCSNHPTDRWSDTQRNAALRMADEIVDVPFPHVDPLVSTEQIKADALGLAVKIVDCGDVAVAMVQGEMTLLYHLVSALKADGITCVAACAPRQVVETVLQDGSTRKDVIFQFVQFREY